MIANVRDDDSSRTDLLVDVNWLNPYTNKTEEISIWLPVECVDNNIRPYFKDAFDIDIADDKKFVEFLEVLGKDPSNLYAFEDLMNICIQDYYKTEYYKRDCADAQDAYELLNNLGEYAEDDEYAE